MRIPGLYRAKRLVWSAYQRVRRPALVLLYHRISEEKSDPWMLCVTPRHFAEHLDVLRYCGFRVAPLSELVTTSAERRDTVAITFDDGYADNLYAAAPVLQKHEAPATFYIASGQIGHTTEFWWDELDRLVFAAPRLPRMATLEAAGRQWSWRLDDTGPQGVSEKSAWRGWHPAKTDRQRLYKELYELLVEMDAQTRSRALVYLRTCFNDHGTARPTHRVLDWDELRRLAATPTFEVGAHTINHISLAALSKSEQHSEILGSQDMLQKQLGCEMRHFSYPYGAKTNYNACTISILKSAKFESACSNFVGNLTASTDRFQIPRIYIEDWNGDEFARRLCLQSSRVHTLPSAGERSSCL